MNSAEASARRVCAVLRGAGYRALFAGGCVRDVLLGDTPKDYDIATDALPEAVAALFPKTFLVGAAFGVVLVVENDHKFEVATFRQDGPYLDGRRPSRVEFLGDKEDACRRDFTVNGLFYDPEHEEVIDYVGGRRDLEDGIIRCVGDPAARFAEDHLRLLRAVRFAARFGFRIEAQTLAAVTAGSADILKTSPERIRDELVKMLTSPTAFESLSLLDRTGLLAHVLPEIDTMKGVEQPEAFHPEGDVFVHTLLVMKNLSLPRSTTLAFGALLHDVGKPDTQTFEDRIRFNQHEKVGAKIARKICRRLRFSNAETERIVWLVGQHMRLATIPEMRESKRKRFVREEGFAELLELCRADCLSSHGNLETIGWIEDYRAHLPEESINPPPLLNGDALIALGYQPGPQFKAILRGVEDAQLEGLIATAKEARAYVLDKFPF